MRKLQNYWSTFCLLAFFLLRSNSYIIEEFEKAVSREMKKAYEAKEKKLKLFSNSDFYDMKILKCRMSPEVNELLTNLIKSSYSTAFNIFLEYQCSEQRSKKNPEISHMFELKKLGANNFAFVIQYIDDKDKTSFNKRMQIGITLEYLKYLLNSLFKVSLVFRKFYPNLIRGSNYSYRYSYANYRFMIFDAELDFKSVVESPVKTLKGSYKNTIDCIKPVQFTKLKFSGRLPRSSTSINYINSIVKEKIKIFSALKKRYAIQSAWRFENNLYKDINKEENAKEVCSYSLEILRTTLIQELSKDVSLGVNIRYLTKNDYNINYRFLSLGSVKSADFEREYTISSNFFHRVCIINFHLREYDEYKKKFRISSSLFKKNEIFEIFTDISYNITKVVDTVQKFCPSKRNNILNDYEYAINEIINEIASRM